MASLVAGAEMRTMKLGQVCGATVSVHPSCWAVSAAAFALVLTGAVTAFGLGPFLALALAAGAATLLLILNVGHEFGHACVGAAFGLAPRDIVLYGWGARTTYGHEVNRPRDYAIVSLAGPIVNLAIAALAGGVLCKLGPSGYGLIALMFCAINLMYAGLNLVPVYPRDGGRVLHALLWTVLRDEVRAETLCRQIGILVVIALLGLCFTTGYPQYATVVAIVGGESFFHDLAGPRTIALPNAIAIGLAGKSRPRSGT